MPLFPDYSRTERIVILVDLNSSVPHSLLISSIRKILLFPSLSSTLFAVKCFSSALSPLLFHPSLPNISHSLSFDLPDSTSLLLPEFNLPVSPPSADFLSHCLRQLLFDYSWDLPNSPPSYPIPSNLVLLFSPSPKSNEFFQSVGVKASFRGVQEMFCSRSIHFSWIDTGEVECDLVKEWLKDFGWGFCGIRSILYGSVLVPFGLIYPVIAIRNYLVSYDSGSGFKSQVKLSILDKHGKPMECSYCNVDLFRLTGYVSAEICVKAIGVSRDQAESRWTLSDPVIVKERVEGDRSRTSGSMIWEKVLQIMGVDSRKRVPLWQLLLIFLYTENRLAMVSYSPENGEPLNAILQPLTISSANLFFINENPSSVYPEKTASAKNDQSRRNAEILEALTWDEFCETSLENFEARLEDVYFNKNRYSSKKLKFLRCWMKQVMRPPETNEPITSSQASEADFISEDTSMEASRAEEELKTHENGDVFLDNLPSKFKEGVKSEDISLESLAGRLVKECIFSLCQHNTDIFSDLSKILLTDPREFASTRTTFDELSNVHLREIEIQILFRMEILQSEIGPIIGITQRQALVKGICTFLELFDLRQQGGIKNYADKVIKHRYGERNAEVVKQIYSEMDIDFDGEEDDSDPLLVSEEANSDNFVANDGGGDPSFDDERRKKLVEAEDSRQKAKRCRSFSTWIPDLRRIWAPKRIKASTTGSARCRKRLMIRDDRSLNDVVIETPVASSKRPGPR